MAGSRSREVGPAAPEDVRLRGFPDRATLEDAQAWVDRHAGTLGAVDLPLGGASGRILAATLACPAPLPRADRAGIDGYAVRAADTVGASALGPLTLRLADPSTTVAAGAAALIAAGAALPAGADSILGFDSAQAAGPLLEVIAPVAEGAGVERAGQQLRAGAPLLPAGRRLGPADLALLASLGLSRLAVVAAPRVRLIVAGPKGGAGALDADGPMLGALVARDGGVPAAAASTDLRAALRTAPGACDLALVVGRTGTGADDEAPAALANAGRLERHGIALSPGGSAGLGAVGELPVLLLPGDPLACLAAYELLAGRLIRGLAGRGAALPHRLVEGALVRKLVSTVGVTELCQVRLVGDAVEPIGVAEFGGLAAATRGDGFVLVPAALEGYPPGARVTVHLH